MVMSTGPESAASGTDPNERSPIRSAAEHLTSNVPRLAPETLAAEARESLIGTRFDSVAELAVCHGDRFVGLVAIEDLLAAEANTPVSSIMDSNPPVVHSGVNQEMAAWTATQRSESSLAVVDEDGRFQGIIPPQCLIEVLLWAHGRDLARLGGFLHDAEAARNASEEPIARRFVHRMPWLILGLMGAFAAANIVGTFEEQLSGRVILAFFIPGVVYLADAVGTQTETLLIRGLSVGVPIGRIVLRELITGLLVGIALSLLFFPIAWLWWGEMDVAVAVSLALMSACSIASVVATTLPWLLQRFHLDPAFGSGPLATVIQDLLSILLYFGIAIWLFRLA
jgi:magnesium transporter